MLRHFKKSIAALFVVLAAHSVSAFSLLGPLTTWMDDVKGYINAYSMGGPMNLGEEYRWNTPVVTYGFDESFLNYFGVEGVKAVEDAVKMINDLPPMTDVDLSKYPLNTKRRNYRASALNLLDLKSFALWNMIMQLGLTAPEEYVWCVRNDYHDGASPYNPYLTVIRRNFDPETWEPSSYVNGTLYTYNMRHTDSPAPHTARALKSAPDPLAFTYTSVASGFLNVGDFYSGLTRDDIGGLRYLYRFNNYNVEDVVSNTAYSVNQSLATGTGSAWMLVGLTNLIPGAVPTGTPWYPLDYTNIVYGNTNTAGLSNATTTVGTGLTNVSLIGLRPGMEKVRLYRVIYDSYLGQLSAPITNRYVDTVISSNVAHQRVLERVVTQPDIVFAAADLGFDDTGIPWPYRRTFNPVNMDALNGNVTLDGPGIMTLPILITYNKLGPWLWNGPGFLSETTATTDFIWGAYDGSTNDPIVFPKGSSINQLERQVLGY